MQFVFNYHTEQDDELVEILDANQQPFMVAPLIQARKQALSFKAVITLLHGPQNAEDGGFKNGLYVQQRSKFSHRYPEFWDVSAIRHVRAGESSQEAATRSLYEELGVRCTQCNYKAHLESRPEFEHIKLSVFHALAPATTPAPDHKGISRLLCLGPKELKVLLRDFKEQTTPALRLVLEAGLAFP